MTTKDKVLDIAMNLNRVGNWAADDYDRRRKRITLFLDQTDNYLLGLEKEPVPERFKKTLERFKYEYVKLSKDGKKGPQDKFLWAERMMTWGNILTHRAQLIAVSLLLISLSTAPTALAQEAPPTTSPVNIGSTDKGIAMIPGWNYFKVAAGDCTIKNVFNELQADGGGALVVDELWKMSAKGGSASGGEDGKWKMIGFADPTVDTTTVDANSTFAFNSSQKLFFDIAPDACTKENMAREEQIEEVRAASRGSGGENFLEKIASVPGEFWSNLISTLGFKKTENALPAPKYEADSALFQKLNVLGESTVTDLGVTGRLTVGTVWIDALPGSLNALGTLKLQDKVGGPIQFLGGLASIDTNGNLNVQGKLLLPKSTGQATIKAGETQVTVQNTLATKDSKIFTSPLSDPGSPLFIKSKNNGSFSVEIRFAPEADLTFDWWIVN